MIFHLFNPAAGGEERRDGMSDEPIHKTPRGGGQVREPQPYAAQIGRDDPHEPASKADIRDLERQMEWLAALFTEKFNGMEKYMDAKIEGIQKDMGWLKWILGIGGALLVGLLLVLIAR